MNRIRVLPGRPVHCVALVGLAAISLLSPMTGYAQLSALHRSNFKIDKLSTRESGGTTYVDGEITSNAKKEARTVNLIIRWFDKNGKVLDQYQTHVFNLAPGETLPFRGHTRKNPEMVRYVVTVDYATD